MSAYTLPFFTIYPEDIEHAVEVADDAMEEAGIDLTKEGDIDEDVITDALNQFGSWNDITTSVIEAYYSACADVVYEKFGRENVEVDYYINGYDSHFVVRLKEIQ